MLFIAMISQYLILLCSTGCFGFILYSVLSGRRPALLSNDHRRMASTHPNFSFLHATESPFHTSMGNGERPDENIYTAKQIADFVLSVKELSSEELKSAQDLARNHGLLKYWTIPKDVKDGKYDEIFSSGCLVAIAHFYNKLSDENFAKTDIIKTYEKCVCAVNSLTYLLQTPFDRSSRLPGPVKLSRGERWKLDRVWDISVCLLGAIKARCGFQWRIRVGDIPIAHDVHYKRAAEMALDKNNRFGGGRICQKALMLLTREEIEPFIQPYLLIKELKFEEAPDVHFNHKTCTEDECKFDTSATEDPASMKDYHVPGCSGCMRSTPPEDSLAEFTKIANRGMPAVNVSRSEGWWVEAGSKTLVVSHVWRDGIWGTRDNGINKCIHNLLAKMAKDHGCDSYWIDCATIPEEKETRETMIMRINSTFMNAGVVLCWDERLATSGSDIPETLLSLVVSAWNRRAWTLLEGNRGRLEKINFLKWTDQTRGSYELFNLREKLDFVFDKLDVPLWIRSALVELLPYSGAPLPVDAAGLLLSGRHASRVGDSEVIWGLLRPIEARDKADDFDYQNPYLYAKNEVDVAFISSNAERFRRPNGTQSWRPGKTKASAWVRTAYGGIKATIIEADGRRHLKGEWWAKEGLEWRDCVKWDNHNYFKGFALICPILKGDPRKMSVGKHSSAPVKGLFRTSLVMECTRAIVITRETEEDIWQWQGLVDVKDGRYLIFKTGENREFIIGGSKIH